MKFVKAIILFCLIIFFSLPSHAATIAAPAQDETVYAGSTITIVVKPDPGEQWQGFVMGFKAFEYDSVSKTFKLAVHIPNGILGYLDYIRVHGVDKEYNEIELKRTVFVKLPQNVALQGIVAGGDGGDTFVSLEKMPAGSRAVDVENYETEQLRTYGKYSDTVNRELTASANGTTYTSSDEKVVTVSPEGKITAQGLGAATISVKNGKYSATVKVIVKPYE